MKQYISTVRTYTAIQYQRHLPVELQVLGAVVERTGHE